jgi:hypothetical protein
MLLWFFKAMPTVTAHFGFKFGFVYITPTVRTIDFNGMAWLELRAN